MGGPYLSSNWGNLLEPGLREVFSDAFKEKASMLPAIFNMQTSEKAYEYDLQTDGLGEAEEYNGTITYEGEVEGHKTTYTPKEYVKGTKIERSLVADDLYNIIDSKSRQLGIVMRRRREKDGASVFNNAFTSTITGGDSLSLCNSAHTSKNSSTTQSNTQTLAFTDVNVETMRQAIANFKDGKDNSIECNMDMLIVPLSLESKAWELINSKGKIDTANNNSNFHYGKYKLAVWNKLTDSTAWFGVDSQYMKMFLKWFDREPVQFFKASDFDSLMTKFAAYMRYSFGWSDWRWIMGSNPA